MASFNTTSYDKTSVAYNMMSPIFIDGSNSIPMSGSQYYNGVFGNVMAGFCVDGIDSILGGNVIITGDVSCCSRLLVKGNVSIGGNTAFTTYLPTSSLVPSATYQLTNKTYVDTQVATKTTLTTVQSNNNVFTGTTSFNSSLPTSTLTPTTASQLVTKGYVDAQDGTKTTLAEIQSNNNTWTGTQNFTNTNAVLCNALQAFNRVNTGYIVANTIYLGDFTQAGYLGTAIKGMSCGKTSGTTNGTVSVSFGFTFAYIPCVTATPNYAGIGYMLSVMVFNVTLTGFQYNILNTNSGPPSHFEQFSGINWTAMCTGL